MYFHLIRFLKYLILFFFSKCFFNQKIYVSILFIMYFFYLFLMWFIMLVDILVLNFPCLCEINLTRLWCIMILNIIWFSLLKKFYWTFLHLFLFPSCMFPSCIILVWFWNQSFGSLISWWVLFLFLLFETFWIRLKLFILEGLVEYAYKTIWPGDSLTPKMGFNHWFNYFDD